MILIAAALREELDVARSAVLARNDGKEGLFAFVRTGIGPGRAAAALRKAIRKQRPDSILCVGYAGALDPSLCVGDLVAVSGARLLEFPPGTRDALQKATCTAERALSIPATLPASVGRWPIRAAGVVTAPWIVGRRQDREYLFARFGAAAVDMETAALAGAAALEGLELSALRSISDAVTDDYLEPLAHDGRPGVLPRALKVLGAGSWRRRLEEWRDRTRTSRDSLREGLEIWLSCTK